MLIIGCSGPNAGQVIFDNTQAGYFHAMIMAAMLATSVWLSGLMSQSRRWPIVFAVAFMVHPAWTVSAIGGDCGTAKYGFSWICTAMGCLVIVGQMTHAVWWRISKRKP